MNDKTALALAVVIIGIFLSDYLIFGWDLHLFLGRKMLELTAYLAFWR